MPTVDEQTVTDCVPLLEAEDLFSLDDGSSLINEAQGACIGSMSCRSVVDNP